MNKNNQLYKMTITLPKTTISIDLEKKDMDKFIKWLEKSGSGLFMRWDTTFTLSDADSQFSIPYHAIELVSFKKI